MGIAQAGEELGGVHMGDGGKVAVGVRPPIFCGVTRRANRASNEDFANAVSPAPRRHARDGVSGHCDLHASD